MVNESIHEPYRVHLDSVHDWEITIKRERNEPAGEWSERGFQKISLTTHRTARTNERIEISRLVENIRGKEDYTK